MDWEKEVEDVVRDAMLPEPTSEVDDGLLQEVDGRYPPGSYMALLSHEFGRLIPSREMTDYKLKARAVWKQARLVLLKMLWHQAADVVEDLGIQAFPQHMENATLADCAFMLGYAYRALEEQRGEEEDKK